MNFNITPGISRLVASIALVFALSIGVAAAAVDVYVDTFEPAEPSLTWSVPSGTAEVVDAALETRLDGVDHPTTGSSVMKVGLNGVADGTNLALAGGVGRDMTVEAWVFCCDNESGSGGGDYQAIVARASQSAGLNMIRMAWDSDHSEAGDSGDGWVKLQAYDGATWDYLGIDSNDFGAATNGYIVNGTEWPAGWRKFKLEVVGQSVSAYVDDMTTPVVTGTMTINLLDGQGGFYTYANVGDAGYYDNYRQTVVPPPPSDYDVILRGGEVFEDGYSSPTITDIGIIGERIATIGDLTSFTATNIIDAAGLTVAPGFIDTHTHADGGGQRAEYLRQGVTTIVAGNCGSSRQVTSVAAYLDSLEGALGPNFIDLIGHNSLRSAVGLSGSTPSAGQMDGMKSILRQGLEAGAVGMSTGLAYATGFNSETEEVIELAKVLTEYDALYATHMRSEMAEVLESVDEAVRIGREAGCRVQISHAKCLGVSAWGKSLEYIAKVDDANASGGLVMMDQYPYTASQTTINAVIPNWAETAWSDALTNQRDRLTSDVADLIAERGGADRIYLISGDFSHKWLSDVADNLSKAPEIVVIDYIGLGGANAIYHSMLEEEVQNFMVNPRTMVGSDGPASSHPRGAGTFPRFWGYYARDLGLFDKKTAVLKTSTLAAEQFGLIPKRRGALREGFYADIVVFDAETIDSPATFDNPRATPIGIEYVLVNGRFAVNGGNATSNRAGRVIRFNQAADSTGIVAW